MTEEINTTKAFQCSVGVATGCNWKAGSPLVVTGCMIMLCESGSADFTINSRRLMIKSGDIAFIVFDMVTVPVCISRDFEAKYIELDFDASQHIFFLVTSNRFWEYVYASPVFALPVALRRVVDRWFKQLDWISHNSSVTTAGKVFRNEMENFMLIMAEQVEMRLGLLGINPPKNRAWVMVNEFLGLLNRYYTRHHDVAFYAGKLNVTPNYLNILVKRNIGVTAKQQINIQLGLVMKMLLDTTDLSVKEIAARLHYDDPSYLCRAFRKLTGSSPISYRNASRTSSLSKIN